MKKTVLSIGGIITLATPLATVISCSNKEVKMYNLLPTYTAQADQLIALGIKPNYYPLQLDEDSPFGYITNPQSLMFGQSEKFKKAFAKKIKELTPLKVGQSWWNQQALDDGERGSDPEYWQHMGGTLVMYEHYLLDDGDKKVNESTAPKHYKTNRNYIETNFRVSRDPFTRMPKVVIEALLDQENYDGASGPVKKIVNELLEIARKIEGENPNLKAVDGKGLPSGKPKRESSEDESWIYNDFVYARNYHTQFLDNDDFQKSSSKKWLLNSDKNINWVFDKIKENDDAIKKLFFESTFKNTEVKMGLADLAKEKYSFPSKPPLRLFNYSDINMPISPKPEYHHPIYEQQEEIGGAPMFEGAQRDNMLYFYNTAAKLSNSFKGINKNLNDDNLSEYEKDAYSKLNNTFKPGTVIRTNLENAEINAEKINTQMRIRMLAIKMIVNAIKNPTFGIVTIAPGEGANTVQTSSKYSFIYNELGFTQPIPNNLLDMAKNIEDNVSQGNGKNSGTFFNMDDNGWWWNLGSPKSSDFNEISSKRTGEFKSKFDLGIITTQTDKKNKNWNNMKLDEKTNILDMFKGNIIDPNNLLVDYNVWNEGLKTPFVLHMILDYIVKELKDKYGASASITDEMWSNATNWGKYFTNDFVK